MGTAQFYYEVGYFYKIFLKAFMIYPMTNSFF